MSDINKINDENPEAYLATVPGHDVEVILDNHHRQAGK